MDDIGSRARPCRYRMAASLVAVLVAGLGFVGWDSETAARAAASTAPAATGRPPVAGTEPVAGATIVGKKWLTERTLQLTVATDAFTSPTLVEVMFPTTYDEDTARRWPVTYYLAGTNGDQTWFRTAYDGEALTASYPSIVVAPRGNAGYWSDWYNYGAGGPPMYETFVTQQLIPLIDANFRTIGDRAHRAVLGESMGGYGSLMLAARHPDLFVAASSLSGAVDSNWAPGAAVLSASPVIDTSPPDSIYGPRATNEVRWRGHNPTDLAENLGAVDVQLYTGNGVLGAREDEPVAPAFCLVEATIIKPETQSLHNKLTTLGIRHEFTEYEWGCHTPALIKQEIIPSLSRFASIFAQDVPPPSTFDYRSIEPQFSVFGWTVRTDPDRALEFLGLHDVSDTGLRITGSGTTAITTPPMFKGAKPVIITIDGNPTTVYPDKTGRITFTVNLGPANQRQQYTAGYTRNVQTSVVTFSNKTVPNSTSRDVS